MPVTDADEIARRAVLRAIDPLTELVTLFDSDPQNLNPDQSAVFTNPDDLLNLTFARVGIDSDLLILGFIKGLKGQLPRFSDKIQEIFGNLKPGVQIGLVRDRLTGELRLAIAQGKKIF